MPRLGISGVETVAWGIHFCLFYRSLAELRQLIVPYVQAGLEDGECCMWIPALPLTQSEALRDLEEVIPDAEGYSKNEQLQIIPCTDWYLSDGMMDCERVLKAWHARLESALRRGFAGLRVAGDAGWIETKQQRDAFLAYEQIVTDAATNKRMMAICTYPAAAWNPDDMLNVMQCHHSVVLRGSAGWKAVPVCCS
jgi:hypothetical protein